jgi:hypothetical protein
MNMIGQKIEGKTCGMNSWKLLDFIEIQKQRFVSPLIIGLITEKI